jgi:hypothetical protein
MDLEKELEALKQEILEQWSHEELVFPRAETTEADRETSRRNREAERKTAHQ